VSRYLRRVLARTTGQPLGALQPSRPQRWSGAAADPFAAADAAAADPGAPPAAGFASPGAGRDADGDRPAPFAAPTAIASGAVQDGAGGLDARSRPRRIVDRALGAERSTLAAPVEHRVARGDRPVPASGDPAAPAPTPASASPAAGSPASGSRASAPLASPTGPRRPGAVDGAHRDERSPIAMPPPVTPRHEPAAAAGPRRDDAAADRPASVIAAPIPRAPAAPVAASRPEIVIGRISVIVESARPPAAAPRTIVRRVTAAAGAADSDAPPQRFGRFGLGQL
jgi:hypothetical protein